MDIIVPKPGASVGQQGHRLPTYFPCRMFDPRSGIVPDPATYANYSGCHLSPTARSTYFSFQNSGVPKPQGGFDKAGRIYYTWTEVDASDHLVIYNGYVWTNFVRSTLLLFFFLSIRFLNVKFCTFTCREVLNLNLLKSLPRELLDVPQGGLIDLLITNASDFIGTDMSYAVANYRSQNGLSWKKEAECLSDIIRVGMVDTMTFGCIVSNIVLYISLAVILGVIIVKFSLAVAFGWFLSWKLGNFKDGQSYADRMKREQEIENWTADIYTPANITRSPYLYPPNNPPRKKSIIPQTSRFTKPEPGKLKYGGSFELSSQNMWRRPSSATVSTIYGSTITSPFSSTLGTNSTNPSTIYNPKADFNQSRRQSELTFPISRRSSVSTTTPYNPFSDIKCPLPMSKHMVAQPDINYKPFNFTLAHTICLVTAYSEGIQGLRTTLDSIATTDYPNSHKLIVAIADGVITGSGNEMSTPDICLSMMRDFIVPKDEVQPYSYIAIADGSKRHNMAKVYAGYYRYDSTTVGPAQQQRVPMILIAKCGSPAEKDDKKPGNRGKRDSQIILMSFLQKVMFDERMTHLDYEIFNSIWRVAGITPDKYESVLMVDADTKIFPDSLSRLISCMAKDPEIAGLCGETKIGNKTDSWVSMMQGKEREKKKGEGGGLGRGLGEWSQCSYIHYMFFFFISDVIVFEYYISHHQSKAFESIFGGVTCLPGCFCMYRIKAPKGPNGYWVPILANPDIVEHYSENVVDTLHKKNLLLLGEDRYLSTLMLRTFPKRKMIFVPQAVCKTVVPDTFSVLLSQRRRWINSTIHNLMELVLVQDLCGTFCFSMQFVVFMELVGTLALPAAISFTLYLVILACIGQPAVIPLILLAIILGLPAVLIVMTSRKMVYVGWMIVSLATLACVYPWNILIDTNFPYLPDLSSISTNLEFCATGVRLLAL
jgi:chitin synthase